MYSIEIEDGIGTYGFYEKILPQVEDYIKLFNYGKENEIVFDFTNVNFINPLVIPNLCTIGLIIKRYTESPANLFIPWKPDLLSYLDSINFLQIVRKDMIFNLDERYIGGYEKAQLHPNCKLYSFSKGCTDMMVRDELLNSNLVLETYQKFDKTNIFNTQNSKIFMNKILELVDNAKTHGLSDSYAMLQLDYGKRIKFKYLRISVSDIGIGFYESIRKKTSDKKLDLKFLSDEEFVSKRYSYEKNLYAIFEALYFRKSESIYGLYDICNEVLNMEGRIRIHCEDIQLIITNKNFKNTFGNFDDENGKEIINYFLTKLRNKESMIERKYSDLRIYSSVFKGVHLEIEIPIHEGGAYI